MCCSLNANCAAQQTNSYKKSLELDDGGTGYPPCDGGVGGRSGSGGGDGRGSGRDSGWHWSSGFFIFAFLAFLAFLKDQESEEPYCQGEDAGIIDDDNHFISSWPLANLRLMNRDA